MKKIAFLLLIVSFLGHAQSHDTILSSACSSMANHKLGIAGLSFIGGGLVVHRLINHYEHRRLKHYNETHPVRSLIKNSDEAQDLINEKLKRGYEIIYSGVNWNDKSVQSFRKINLLGKCWDDKIQFTVLKTQSIQVEKVMNANDNYPRMGVSVKEGDSVLDNPNIQVTTHERKLKSIGYANWIRNVSIGIGILTIFGEIYTAHR
ncbi:MAG TPA: hypothetical protein VHO47_02980 [Candidatus Babeliales bacterium]|nr:hypothetical protein [Candidatus Babeliales bacterium]